MFEARMLKFILPASLLITLMAVSDALAAGWTYTTIATGGAIDNPAINDHGEVVFDAGDYNCSSCLGVWKWRPGSMPVLVTSAPIGGSSQTQFSSVTITNNGKIGFESLTTNANGRAGGGPGQALGACRPLFEPRAGSGFPLSRE